MKGDCPYSEHLSCSFHSPLDVTIWEALSVIHPCRLCHLSSACWPPDTTLNQRLARHIEPDVSASFPLKLLQIHSHEVSRACEPAPVTAAGPGRPVHRVARQVSRQAATTPPSNRSTRSTSDRLHRCTT